MRHWSAGQLLGLLSLVWGGGSCTTAAQAQWAAVPRMDVNGDFQTTKVQGNRGDYQQMLWLVVDRDPEGLNCRPLDGSESLVKIDYGNILMTKVESAETNAIFLRDGKPWLNVTLTSLSSPLLDLRQGAERSGPYHCQVRASTDLIAPINNSSIDELRRSAFDEETNDVDDEAGVH